MQYLKNMHITDLKYQVATIKLPFNAYYTQENKRQNNAEILAQLYKNAL